MAFTELTFDSALKDRIASEKAGDIRPIFVLEDGTAISPSAFEKMVSASAAGLPSGSRIKLNGWRCCLLAPGLAPSLGR